MSKLDFFNTIVIGDGQAGLAVGYFLKKRGTEFTIIDENTRTGDAWRGRWDSLRLFTPSKYNGLPGKSFPGQDFTFPTKDEVAEYLEEYAGQFQLPIQHGVTVNGLVRNDQGYRVSTSAGSLVAKHVIVATGAYQKPFTPSTAQLLDSGLMQMHSSAYCNPHQIPVHNILVVGAGNSGVEISLELARAGKRYG